MDFISHLPTFIYHIAGFDVITDLTTTSSGKDLIDFTTNGVKAAAAASGNFTDSTLTVGGTDAVITHVIDANGLATFAKTGPAALTISSDAILAAVVQYLAGGDIGNAGATLVFNATYAVSTRGATAHTFVYQQTTTNAGAASGTDGYSLIDLPGVTLTGVETAVTTDGYLYIA
jgi:hypothetical protein